MQANYYTTARDLITQKANYEFQLSNFFKYYPIEFIKENIEQLFAPFLPFDSDNIESDTLSYNYLFFEELNLMLKNCASLYKHEKKERINPLLLSTYKNINSVINFIKEVIPAAYIFCNTTSTLRTDLIIIMDQHEHKPFDEIHSLLDFAVLGHQNINCTVYTYGTMYDFMRRGHLYYSTFCVPENCVYQKSQTFNLPQLNEEKCIDMINASTLLFEQNMHKAITFFNGAHQFANESESTISAFMLQQACELTYRSLLLSLRGKEIKCHNLTILRKHVSHFVPAIIGVFDENEKKEIDMLDCIQDAYIKSRYDQNYTVNIDELIKLINAADELIQSAHEIFNYHCQKAKSFVCLTA